MYCGVHTQRSIDFHHIIIFEHVYATTKYTRNLIINL